MKVQLNTLKDKDKDKDKKIKKKDYEEILKENEMSNGLETENWALVDSQTKIRPSLSYEHAMIHAGRMFTIENKVDIPTLKVAAFRFAPPSGVYMHFKPANIMNSGAVVISLLEKYSFSDVDGSVLVPMNRNRNSANTSTVVVTSKVDPTITNVEGYATLATIYVPASGTGNARAGAFIGNEEWMFVPGTSYLFTITNPTNAEITVGFGFEWYQNIPA